MLRLATVAALAALVAAPASAQSIRISTAGKSPEQVTAEVKRAAQKVCVREYTVDLTGAQSACVSAIVRQALGQSGDASQVKMATR